MPIFDSHCHLNHFPIIEQLPIILDECQHLGIQQFLLPSTQANEFANIQHISKIYPTKIYPAFGFHPFWVNDIQNTDWIDLEKYLHQNPHAAIGEIGLDFYNKPDQQTKEQQILVFVRQLQLALELDRPISLHLRKANQEFWSIIKNYPIKGLMHAFSGSLEEANAFIKIGFKLGIGSILLNPTAKKIRQTIKQIDLAHIVLETDAPYMKPQAANETFNHPKNILHIAQEIANLKNIQLEQVIHTTHQNTLNTLNI